MFNIENKYLIRLFQTLSIIAIFIAKIDILLKLALLFCYIFLFRQKKWHKHLVIMFVMLLMLAVASQGMIS